MKPHRITTVLITLALVLVSCTDNFDKLNRKPYQVDNEELQREGYIIGSTLKGMQGLVVPTQEHLYQFIEPWPQDHSPATSEPPWPGRTSSRPTTLR